MLWNSREFLFLPMDKEELANRRKVYMRFVLDHLQDNMNILIEKDIYSINSLIESPKKFTRFSEGSEKTFRDAFKLLKTPADKTLETIQKVFKIPISFGEFEAELEKPNSKYAKYNQEAGKESLEQIKEVKERKNVKEKKKQVDFHDDFQKAVYTYHKKFKNDCFTWESVNNKIIEDLYILIKLMYIKRKYVDCIEYIHELGPYIPWNWRYWLHSLQAFCLFNLKEYKHALKNIQIPYDENLDLSNHNHDFVDDEFDNDDDNTFNGINLLLEGVIYYFLNDANHALERFDTAISVALNDSLYTMSFMQDDFELHKSDNNLLLCLYSSKYLMCLELNLIRDANDTLSKYADLRKNCIDCWHKHSHAEIKFHWKNKKKKIAKEATKLMLKEHLLWVANGFQKELNVVGIEVYEDYENL